MSRCLLAIALTCLFASLLTGLGCRSIPCDQSPPAKPPQAAVAGERGWLDEDVPANGVSQEIVLTDRQRAMLHLTHRGDQPARVSLQAMQPSGAWQVIDDLTLPPNSWGFKVFDTPLPGERIRVVAAEPIQQATAWLGYINNARLADTLAAQERSIWADAPVQAGVPSAPIDMPPHRTRYLLVQSDRPAAIGIELDLAGTGSWYRMTSLIAEPGKANRFNFWDAFNPKRIRLVSDTDAVITAQLIAD